LEAASTALDCEGGGAGRVTRGLDAFSRIVWDAGGGTRRYYRPLVIQSLCADDLLWGGDPAGFHATNLLCHLLDSWPVFLSSRRGGLRALGAALAAPDVTDAERRPAVGFLRAYGEPEIAPRGPG
jgi:hypothetical protein